MTLTGEVFAYAFERQFILEMVKGMRGQELLNLHQGEIMVSEYERKFVEMSRFASHMNLSYFAMVRLFENKLHPRYKRMVASSCFSTFHEVFDSARVCKMTGAEDAKAREVQNQLKAKADEVAKSKKQPQASDRKQQGGNPNAKRFKSDQQGF